MSRKTKTRNHNIHRNTESAYPLGFGREMPRTQIQDKKTGSWGKGIGNTQQEADQRAWDDLRSKKESS
jgi:hypothetical protein